jgi:hypothetical protein
MPAAEIYTASYNGRFSTQSAYACDKTDPLSSSSFNALSDCSSMFCRGASIEYRTGFLDSSFREAQCRNLKKK